MGDEAASSENCVGEEETCVPGIYFNQDYTAKLQIQNHLKEKGIRSYIKYPTKLLMMEDKGQRFYDIPQAAEQAYGIYFIDPRADDSGEWENRLQCLGWKKVKPRASPRKI